MITKRNSQSILIILPIFMLLGCSAKMSYAPTSRYSEGDLRSINDEDILKAFQAEPQMKLPARIAWYNMSSDSLLFLIQLQDNEFILDNYIIPKSLIEGFDPLFPSVYSYYHSAQPIDFKGVRLLAARAKCDIVVLVSSRFAEKRDYNGWSSLNILILPALFTPYFNSQYRYSSEVFIFDVRNGFMYRHLKFEDSKKIDFINIWKSDKIAKEVNNKLLKDASVFLKDEMIKLFKNNIKPKDINAGAEE